MVHRVPRVVRLIFAASCCLLLASAAGAQDAEGSKDHPMFSRMPTYFISEYDEQGFGAHEFTLDPEPKRVEGKYWRISYEVKEGQKKAGPIQIGRNYTDLIAKRGGRKLYENLDAGGGTTVATLPLQGHALWLEV